MKNVRFIDFSLVKKILKLEYLDKIIGNHYVIRKYNGFFFIQKNWFFEHVICKFFKRLKGFIPIYPYIYFDSIDYNKIERLEEHLYYYKAILLNQQKGLSFWIINFILSKYFRFVNYFEATLNEIMYLKIKNKNMPLKIDYYCDILHQKSKIDKNKIKKSLENSIN